MTVECREPRENRGRLRHCNGLQTSNATARENGREGGSEIRCPKPGYRFDCARHDGTRSAGPSNFSVQEKDEASPLNCFQWWLNDLHSPLRGMEVLSFLHT